MADKKIPIDMTPEENAEPYVSIIVGAYNEADTIGATLDSVCAQTFSDFECIVIDDGSTDGTGAQVAAYAERDPRFVLFRFDENRGLTHALARGLTLARGNWMARIDAGDTWHPEKLARQLAYLSAHPETGIIGCEAEEINLQSGRKQITRRPLTHEEIMAAIWDRVPFIHSTIVVSMACIREHGGYDPVYSCAQDYDLYFRLLFHTRGYNLPEVLCYRSTHGRDSISLSRWKEQQRCGLRIRWKNYRKHGLPWYRYCALLPMILRLLIPNSMKQLKQQLSKAA